MSLVSTAARRTGLRFAAVVATFRVSGLVRLVFITLSLVTQGAACRNDANDVGTRGVTGGVCDHKDEMSAGAADSLPTFLAALDAVLEHEREWVVEDSHGVVKTDAVLGEITSRLRRVPLERKHMRYVTTEQYVHTSGLYDGSALSLKRIALSAADSRSAVARMRSRLLASVSGVPR